MVAIDRSARNKDRYRGKMKTRGPFGIKRVNPIDRSQVHRSETILRAQRTEWSTRGASSSSSSSSLLLLLSKTAEYSLDDERVLVTQSQREQVAGCVGISRIGKVSFSM